MTQSDPRLDQALLWLSASTTALARQGVAINPASLQPASSDASFRRYFRMEATVESRPTHLILMDAPPPNEDVRPFVHAADIFLKAKINVPVCIAANEAAGFLLLTDLGKRTYLHELNDSNASLLYQDAWRALIRLQSYTDRSLAPYDEAKLLAEIRLFDQWYLPRHIGIPPTEGQMQMLSNMYGLILKACLSQPSVIVHRDYHSRNLMRTDEHNPGVLDFQDAVIGPITYDLVSLFRDAYIVWPQELQLDWAIRYWEDARRAGLPMAADFADFWRDFEWMGLQRHLKVLGIFARLYHRDGKDNYLNDLPAVLTYARDVARRYVMLKPLANLLDGLGDA